MKTGRKTLNSYLNLLIFGTCLLVFVFSVAFEFVQIKSFVESSHAKYKAAILKSAKFALKNPLWDLARDQAQKFAEEVSADPLVIGVLVKDAAGKSFVESHNTNIKLEFAHADSQESSKIEKDGQVIGDVTIYFEDSKPVRDMLEQSVKYMAIRNLIVMAILAFGISALLNTGLLKRIKIISAQATSLGDGSLEEPFLWSEGDELDSAGLALEQTRQNLLNAQLQLIKKNRELQLLIQGLEKEVAERSRMLVNSAKLASLGEMSAGMAHEINNPLTIIAGNILRAKKLLEKDPLDRTQLNQMLVKIEAMLTRIGKIVSGLKTFARQDTNLKMDMTSMNAIIEETLELTVEKFKKYQVEISTQLQDFNFECNSVQISQVLVNLLHNSCDAIQHLENRWVKIETKPIQFQSRPALELSITDSGAGIPKEIRDKLMVPFFTTKDIGQGTGLGLSLSKGIVENHGGSFYIDANHPNTRFVVVLPQTQIQSAKKAA